MRMPIATPHQLARLLVTARKARGWSQAELARKLGLSQSRVSFLELHPEALSLEQLLNWLAALHLELEVGPRGTPTAEPSPPQW
jgi:HTH-type transcriptional regulator/antitoxin HipB